MKLDHAMLLMEDFDIVPQLLPRRDIRAAFRLAADTGNIFCTENKQKETLMSCIHELHGLRAKHA